MTQDTIRDRLRSAVETRKTQEEAATARSRQDASRQRLLKILRRKFTTTIIGSLSQIEAHFGHLWGHGLLESELSPQQREWRETWNLCRTDLLDNGNAQLRACEAEVHEYEMFWKRHQLVLPATQPG